ncbi:MAG: molecular chaperone Hsp20 [Gemmataceae bacterium]
MLARWEPFEKLWREMNRFQREMDRMFERFGVGLGARPLLSVGYPAVNVWEDDEYVYAEAELPGLNLEDLEIYVTGGDQLTIKGNRPAPATDKGVWHRQERPFGAFQRSLTLPVPVDPEKVEARLEHGVLTIKMAKSQEVKPRRIPVKTD